MKTRTHRFVMTVTFNKKCTRARALREVRNDGDINTGTHYCDSTFERGEPETFKVRSIKSAKVVS